MDLTEASPAPGLVVAQPRRGHRWGVEVYLLAHFVLAAGPVATAVDLGTGSGIVALLLAWRGVRVTAVERDRAWLELARRNVARSGLPVTVVEGDARRWRGPPVDAVVCNPPWFDPAAGPIPADPMRAAARATLHGGPAEFVRAGLGMAPRVCLVGFEAPAVGGARVTRWARHGRLRLAEYRAGAGEAGPEEPVDLAAVYEGFRSRGPP